MTDDRPPEGQTEEALAKLGLLKAYRQALRDEDMDKLRWLSNKAAPDPEGVRDWDISDDVIDDEFDG